MYCFQCQETAKNQGCTIKGVCGKEPQTSDLQDLLIYVLKGISILAQKGKEFNLLDEKVGLFISKCLFSTITNANFDDARIKSLIKEAIVIKNDLKAKYLIKFKEKNGKDFDQEFHASVLLSIENESDYIQKAKEAGILTCENEDVRSLRELLIIGVKGLCAYADHAAVLGKQDIDVYNFVTEALASTTEDLSVDQMVQMVLKAGEYSVKAMALLDAANTGAYGNPEITKVNIGVGHNPGILISGHDLKDMKQLLEQTKDTGVDVYTHSEMLPANYYPEFKKYSHLKGNYGSSWWHQNKDFETFNGPILMTTNCIVPVKDSYKDRMFTTGMAGYPGVKHIQDGDKKDFKEIIALAKKCPAPIEIETGEIVGGFAHNQVMQVAGKVVDAIKAGKIKKFVVMAGCDGRQKSRSYFTEVAEALPKDTIILTAGCAKYRYNKLPLGDIDGIPRVLDAGQCNDSYSLAVIALKLKEVFELDDVNKLPLAFDIAWYEQKAVCVLLALLFLGFKHIRLGPTLPAFISPNVAKVLIDNFDIKITTDVESDVKEIVANK